MRAYGLASSVGAVTEAFHSIYMLTTAADTRGDAARLYPLLDELATSATRIGTAEARLIVGMLSGNAAMWSGRYADHAGLHDAALGDPSLVGATVPGENVVVWSQGFESWRLWLLGRADDAGTLARAAVTTARSLPNPTDLAMGIALASKVLEWRGDLDDATTLLDEGLELATEYGLTFWLAALGGFGAAVHLARGRFEEAVRGYRKALDDFRRLDVVVYSPALLAGFATASMRVGQLAEALGAVDQGLAIVGAEFCRWQAAEIWRVRGELLAARGGRPHETESSFVRALEIAREQRARAFELRAATSLARHLVTQQRRAEARALLGPICETFTQGLDTTDPRGARALLHQLAE